MIFLSKSTDLNPPLAPPGRGIVSNRILILTLMPCQVERSRDITKVWCNDLIPENLALVCRDACQR